MELLYLGLIPAARGRGWGRQLARSGTVARPTVRADAGWCWRSTRPTRRPSKPIRPWAFRRGSGGNCTSSALADHWHASSEQVIHGGQPQRCEKFCRRAEVELRVFSDDFATRNSAGRISSRQLAAARLTALLASLESRLRLWLTGDGRAEEAPEVTKDDMEIVSTLRLRWPTRSDKTDSICGSAQARVWTTTAAHCGSVRRAGSSWSGSGQTFGGTSRRRAATCSAIARRSSFTLRRRPRTTATRCNRPSSMAQRSTRGPARGRSAPDRHALPAPPPDAAAAVERRRFASLDTFVAGRVESPGHHFGRDGRPPAGPAHAADVLRAHQRGQDPSVGRHLDLRRESRTSV